MKRSIFRRITAMVLALIMVLSLCVFTSADDAEADDKFDDGAFKVLFIGNSASDDATDSGYQKDSKLYEIMKSMVGDTCRIEIGLCWSGGKTMAWHATVANEGTGDYTFMYHADGDEWKYLGSCNSATALTYTDWDAVILQPWGLEVTRGKANFANGEHDDFLALESSVSFMLDYVAILAPQADIYYYHIWATTTDNDNLDAERKTYESICKYTRIAENCEGTITGVKFAGVVPAGATVQALRGTYLGRLDVNTDQTTIDHTTDPQLGIQRDAVHMSFCIGRYAVGLTFAEKLIPADKRVEGYELPALRTSQIAGELPSDYLEFIKMAVDAAYASAATSGNKQYNVAPLSGFERPIAELIKEHLEGGGLAILAPGADTDIETYFEEIFRHAVYGADAEYDVTVISDYIPGESTSVTAKVAISHGYDNCEAEFTADILAAYTVTTVIGEGGEGAPGRTVQAYAGKAYQDIIFPANGYKIEEVKVNGEVVDIETDLFYQYSTESLDGDVTIEVSFKRDDVEFIVNAGEGGAVIYDGDGKVPCGSTASVDIYPDTGYGVADVKVNGESVGSVETYTIENITENTTVDITFEKLPLPFTDVKKKQWFYDEVHYVYFAQLMNGITNTTFEPNTEMNRAMLVTVLWRMDGSPAPAGKAPFTDLKQAWYKDAVAWAYENQIVNGITNTTFDPTGSVTREQLAAIFYRYAQYKDIDVSEKADIGTYSDAKKVAKYARDAFAWAVEANIITGTEKGGAVLLDPRGNATRAQIAVILQRYCSEYGD